jgi:phage portal protein BeeE
LDRVKFEKISLSPVEMDFLQGKQDAARDIASAFNYPSFLLGIPGDNTYSNYSEARLAAWENKFIPLAQEWVCALQGWLVPMFDPDIILKADFTDIPAMTDRNMAKMRVLQFVDYININEKRKLVNIEPEEGGDVILINAGMIPLTDAGAMFDATANAAQGQVGGQEANKASDLLAEVKALTAKIEQLAKEEDTDGE